MLLIINILKYIVPMTFACIKLYPFLIILSINNYYFNIIFQFVFNSLVFSMLIFKLIIYLTVKHLNIILSLWYQIILCFIFTKKNCTISCNNTRFQVARWSNLNPWVHVDCWASRREKIRLWEILIKFDIVTR